MELSAGLELVDIDYGQLTAQNVSLDKIAEGLIALSYDNPLAHTSEERDASEEVFPTLSPPERAGGEASSH